MIEKDWLRRQAESSKGNDKVALLFLWGALRAVTFVVRSIWYQHVAGPERWYANAVLSTASIGVYVYHQRYGFDSYLFIYSLGAALSITMVRYAFFSARRKRAEKNAAAVLAGAFGTSADKQTACVKQWLGHDAGTIEAPVPTKVKRSELSEAETQIRQRLAAPSGREWRIEWDLTKHQIIVTAVLAIPEMASYRDVMRSLRLRWNEVALGVSRAGLVVWDCFQFPHLLVAGTTGGGKSVSVRVVLLHALRRPRSWRIFVIDLKRVELAYLRRRRNVARVATELNSAFGTVEKVTNIMHKRYEKMERAGVNHFLELPRRLPAIMLAVDEFAQLVSPSGGKSKEAKAEDELRAACLHKIQEIGRLGRAAGIHLVLATQRPDATVLPGSLKLNVEGRLAVGRLNPVSSEMVLEDRAAAELPGIRGRGMWCTPEGLEELQVLFPEVKDVDRYAPKVVPKAEGD